MKVVPTHITKTQLTTALDVGSEQLRKLCKEGLPSVKRNNRLMFSPQSVFDWCVTTGRHKHATRLAGAYPSVAKQVDPPANVKGDMADLDAYVDRVRFNECALHEFVKSSAGNKESLVWAISNYKDACKQRLDVEREISKIRLEQSKVIPREEANRRFAEVGQIVRNRLLGLPGAMAGELVGKKASEINDLLTIEIHNVLEELSK